MTGPRLAVFPGDDYDVGGVEAFDAWVGGRLDAVVTFVRAGAPSASRRRFFAETLTPLWDAGYVPVVTWEPFLLDGDRDGSATEALRARNLLREWAEAVAAWVNPDDGGRRRLVFRPAHEMNGDWYPWSAGRGVSGGAYVALWEALVDAFDDHGPSSDAVTWLWCANAEPVVETPLSAYYPGDDAVDVVGVDGYNWGDSREWSSWQSPTDVFGDAFERVRSLSERPLAVPEVGCTSVSRDGRGVDRKSAWITAAFELFAAADVAFAGWFNADKETDWAVCRPNPSPDAPAVRTLDGTEYAVYPAFERAAVPFAERRSHRSSGDHPGRPSGSGRDWSSDNGRDRS